MVEDSHISNSPEGKSIVSTQDPKAQKKLVIVLFAFVIILLSMNTYFFIKDEIIQLPFLTTKQDNIENTDEEIDEQEDEVIDKESEDDSEEDASTPNEESSRFITDEEGHYIIEDNGWEVVSAYAVTNILDSDDAEAFGLYCLWTIPEKDVLVLHNGEIEFSIENYYLEPNFCEGFPTSVEKGYEVLDYDFKNYDELNNKLVLMRKKENEIYTYRFARENSFYDVRRGEEAFFPDIKYIQMGDLYFIYEGTNTNIVEDEIINIYENSKTGWWSLEE